MTGFVGVDCNNRMFSINFQLVESIYELGIYDNLTRIRVRVNQSSFDYDVTHDVSKQLFDAHREFLQAK